MMQLATIPRLMQSVFRPPPNLSFFLPLADAGAGAVNTTPLFSLGSGTPTFTRATTATTVNSEGIIVSVGTGVARSMYDPSTAVFNNLVRSEEFDNASWNKTALTVVANAATAPDGTITADKIVEQSGSGNPVASQGINVPAGVAHTISLYVRKSFNRFAIFEFEGSAYPGVPGVGIDFDLGILFNNGTGTPPTSSSIIAVGEGWFRVTVTATAAATGAATLSVRPSKDGLFANRVYVGDGVSGLYVWGAQFEIGSTAGRYVRTTSAARSDFANYLGYLAEGARTNLCLQSEDFSNASWIKTDVTITANSIASPDGATTADLFTEGSAGTADTRQSVTVVDPSTNTLSFFVKAGTAQWFRVAMFIGGTGTFEQYIDIRNGVLGTLNDASSTISVSGTPTIVAYPNGWFRVIISYSVAGGTLVGTTFQSATANGNSTRVSGSTYYVWGVQQEAGAFASSYIPTTTLAVTRNADLLTYASASNIGAATGTLYCEYRISQISNTPIALSIDDGTGNERFIIYSGNHFAVVDGGVTQADVTSGATVNVDLKKAAAYAVNDFAISGEGGAVGTDTGGTLPTVTTVRVSGTGSGQEIFGTIRNIRIWNVRLPNASLQVLTG